jgi:hypothetical protein
MVQHTWLLAVLGMKGVSTPMAHDERGMQARFRVSLCRQQGAPGQ